VSSSSGAAKPAHRTGQRQSGPPRRMRPGQSVAARIERQRRAVKNQAVIAATWLVSNTGTRSRRAMAASIWRRIARPCQKGMRRIDMHLGWWRISSSMGSKLYRRRGQKLLSSMRLANVMAAGRRPVPLPAEAATGKVALFVEDVVDGSRRLCCSSSIRPHPAERGVDGWLAIPAAGIRCRNSRLAALTPGRSATPASTAVGKSRVPRPVHRRPSGSGPESSAFQGNRQAGNRRSPIRKRP